MMYGVMLDCSRNGVQSVKSVKRYAELIAKMGYNTLMLYTEDTYEVEGEPYFGYMRGRYTKDELKEIDAHCEELGIELIPCIQTLAHLSCIFKWNVYQEVRDCDDILLCGEEKTYELIEHMFATLSECFHSKKIHIGMDEAYKVGLGKYMEKNGYENRFDIINKHLHRVCAIAQKYGYEPMFWSDMFCKLAANTGNYYTYDETALSKICTQAALPQEAALVYWDYYSKDYEHYVHMLRLNKAFGRKVYFAGGAWTWKGFAPANTFSMETTTAAMQAVRDCGVDGWFMTVWGDDGNECSPLMILPSLLYAIEAAKGNTDMNDIRQKFYEITGADFDTFLLLDELDKPGGAHTNNPSKYLFYNDPFLGLQDHRCKIEDDHFYHALAQKLASAEKKGSFTQYFDVYEKLCHVLEIKSSLGVRTRAYYQEGSKEALRRLAEEDYALVIDRIKVFHKAFQSCWMQEKKPQGFEIQDIRIGGLLQRLNSCRERILAYADGEVSSIPELEEDVLQDDPGMLWNRIVTPGVVLHSI